jgi:hypothetical protein
VSADDGISGTELWAVSDEAGPVITSLEWTSDRFIRIRFSEDVEASLRADDLVVRGAGAGGAEFTPVSVSFNRSEHAATFAFDAPLPDDDYVASVGAGAVSDASGNAMREAFLGAFFALGGDINRDRSVDFDDLAILAQNYNKPSGATASTGDINGDAAVDFSDLAIMAQNYNTSLPPLIVAAPVGSRTGVLEPAAGKRSTRGAAVKEILSKPVGPRKTAVKPALAKRP